MMIDKLFSEADFAAVRAAVKEAESGTSGEIVPYVVPASDPYLSAVWKGTALGALLGPLVALAVFRFGGFWGTALSFWIALPAAAGAAVGHLLAVFVPPLKRRLAGREVLTARVHEQAMIAFVEEEVFRTRERTGILLFVSLFERRVVVLGDTGINRQVELSHWNEVVDVVVDGIAAGRPAAALLSGIKKCGELLTRFGVAIRPDDTNELSDELRRRDMSDV